MKQPFDIASLDGTGRVTIPKGVRDKLGLEEGDKVVISNEERGISLIPVTEVEFGEDTEEVDHEPDVDSKIAELEERISRLDSGDFAPAE